MGFKERVETKEFENFGVVFSRQYGVVNDFYSCLRPPPHILGVRRGCVESLGFL